jgi:hypothetical protein
MLAEPHGLKLPGAYEICRLEPATEPWLPALSSYVQVPGIASCCPFILGLAAGEEATQGRSEKNGI